MRRAFALVSLVLALGFGAAVAQTPPDPSDLLFDRPQWQAAQAGAALNYRYARKSPLADVFGDDIEDTIGLTLDPGASPEARTVHVNMFSQKRHRAAGPDGGFLLAERAKPFPGPLPGGFRARMVQLRGSDRPLLMQEIGDAAQRRHMIVGPDAGCIGIARTHGRNDGGFGEDEPR